ncbi:gastrin-releasing peptide isoform X1 [Cyprinodon tularosa]|uniref:gastrin-releasing peptide isoform X1 n=1 Tax=Cyprinodon tularosa TaxID=77115 RepID=UPI0018E255C1|nr:gastrin-releasing peptide isoform X1 [Cyprinodon tularosa]
MCAVRLCYPWSYRALWSVFIILAAAPCFLRCSEKPALVGKMYPRGNHWAVGHLMGKKSLPEKQQVNLDYITLSQSDRIVDQDQTVKALSPKKQLTILQLLHNNKRGEYKGKYLQEMLHLFLLALKLQDNESS